MEQLKALDLEQINEKYLYEFMKSYDAKPDESLYEHSGRLISCAKQLNRLGYLKEDALLDELYIACREHDLGKINPHFQARVHSKGKRFDEKVEIGHNVLSLYLIDLKKELDTKFSFGKHAYYRIANAVLNHHHYVNNMEVIAEKKELIQKNLSDLFSNAEAFQKFVKKLGYENFNALYARVGARALKGISESSEKIRARLLKGLLIKCDHAASARVEAEFQNDFLPESMERMGYHWNELQRFCKENVHKNLIVTAPTGMGKTEAALLWIGQGKGVYVLPLQVAINAIYKRVKHDILKEEDIEKRLGILHGNMLAQYMKFRDFEAKGEYEKFFYYYERSKLMSLPLIITTPDQCFDFVYKYEGHEARLAMFSYSKVVIDEIQAYSPDLLAYLIYGICEIVKFGGKFAIFTATLPPFIKEYLDKRYCDALSERESELREYNESLEKWISHVSSNTNNTVNIVKEYESQVIEKVPLLYRNFSDPESTQLRKIRHHIKLLDGRISSADILSLYKSGDKKILVVCNTIKQAQELYEELKEGGSIGEEASADQKINVRLLHAKFIKRHRDKKEMQILDDGRTFDSQTKEILKKKIIWISTQIVEASLDIDFDVIFTEITDLSALFQRMGRCNRKGLKPTESPNCFIYTGVDERLFIHGDRGFIDRRIQELSVQAILSHHDGILTEDQKFDLIQNTLTSSNLGAESAYYNRFLDVYDYISKLYAGEKTKADVRKEFRNIQSYKAIPKALLEQGVEEQGYREELMKILESLSSNKKEIDKLYISLKHADDISKKRGAGDLSGEDLVIRAEQESNQAQLKAKMSDLRLKRLSLKNELNSYCLNVGSYDMSSKIHTLSSYGYDEEEIYLVEGEYSEELGFKRAKKEGKSSSESYDIFF